MIGAVHDKEIELLNKSPLDENKIRLRFHVINGLANYLGFITAEKQIGNKKVIVPVTPNVLVTDTPTQIYKNFNAIIDVRSLGIDKASFLQKVEKLNSGEMTTFYVEMDKELIEPVINLILTHFSKETEQKTEKF